MMRVEDKISCSNTDFFLLNKRLSYVLSRDEFQGSTPGYKVSSVYFDTPDNKFYRQVAEGISVRQKYRIRIYNNDYSVIKLEVKAKEDGYTNKLSRTITLEQMQALMNGQTIEDSKPSLNNPITLFNLAIKTQKLAPKIIVMYDRDAFIYRPGNVRITFDSNISYSCDFESFSKQKKVVETSVEDLNYILEVKYDSFIPQFICNLLEAGNVNQISYSKYERSVTQHERGTICQQKM